MKRNILENIVRYLEILRKYSYEWTFYNKWTIWFRLNLAINVLICCSYKFCSVARYNIEFMIRYYINKDMHLH